MNELLGRTCRAISVLPLGLRVEPEDAQFLRSVGTSPPPASTRVAILNAELAEARERVAELEAAATGAAAETGEAE